MEIEDRNNTLSQKSHWDRVVGNAKLPRIYSRDLYNVRKFDHLFKSFIDGDAKTFFEVGCGSSGWLPYFKKYYGMTVSGLDYSEVGCWIADKNLDYFDRRAEEMIHRADITKIKKAEFGYHDIVFSYGLIEHFDDPLPIVREMGKLATDQGQIITVVPNMAGFYGMVSRWITPRIYAMHKVMDPDHLERVHKESGFDTQFCGYYGTFYLEAIPWMNAEPEWLNHRLVKPLYLKAVALTARIIETVLSWFGVSRETVLFSPYVIFIGQKRG